ncbi:MAG: chemotaxis protein CheB [Thermodesulfobacteriota bacterium]|nr:chemotaxis protein CheB [Thermodesulfobacteriota bacterium]
MEKKIKVLVVDDALFMRKAVTDILEKDDGIQVLDTAKNGKEGLSKIKKLHPDVITLDIDMPVMDGLTAIRHIMIESPVPIVVLSSLFSDGAITFDALRLGVVDFIPKPSGAISQDIGRERQHVIDRIKIAHSVNLENMRRVKLKKSNTAKKLSDLYGYRSLDHILAVGTNLTGPNTIIRLISGLSPELPAAVVVVQEISPQIISSFVERFDMLVPWKVEVARDGTTLKPGTCYISSNKNKFCMDLNSDGEACLKRHNGTQRPLNVLFSSAAEIYRQDAIGLLLTGLGDDGAEGFGRIKSEGGVTVAQDAECCVYPNLTHHAIQSGTVDIVVNEKTMPGTIESIMSRSA